MKFRRTVAVGTATLATAMAGVLLVGPQATAHDAEFQAKLRDPRGRVVGTVTFTTTRYATQVDARLRPNRYVTTNQFHGFHIHANNNPANGEGCVADRRQPSSTWFVSADGHLSADLQKHGDHQGDLPSPLVLADGTARLSFTTDRIEPGVLRGRAVVLHADPDNFGNVPTGDGATDYQGSAAAIDLTDRTGNAGDRVACGVVRRSW